MKYSVKDNLLKLPENVALWADQNGTPHEPWDKPANAHPILVKAGVKGFWEANPKLDVDHFNSHAGKDGTPATKAQIAAMLAGSVFGFGIPASDPDEYNENGVLHASKINNVEDAMADIVKFLGADTDA